MKIDGCGKAKIFTAEEKQLLLDPNNLDARTQFIIALCYFLVCRMSEARQLTINDVFTPRLILKQEIVLRKEIVKGKYASRTIPVHPKLEPFAARYLKQARQLSEILTICGHWDEKSLACSSLKDDKGQIHCPKCNYSEDIRPSGSSRGKKVYKCKSCGFRFQAQTTFSDHPQFKEIVLKSGILNSYSHGFLFLNPDNPYLFPGAQGKGCLSRSTAYTLFTNAFNKLNIVGASSHSCRRTGLTEMHSAGIPLNVIRKISGHTTISSLQEYLDVTEEQIFEAIMILP